MAAIALGRGRAHRVVADLLHRTEDCVRPIHPLFRRESRPRGIRKNARYPDSAHHPFG
ncbi:MULTISPECIES: hypothetical protein [Inquilinus]|uniref:Transposase n=1 Tax=Inquilinus ginsengisoli TaxID=363840 RepID=A0ABU1JZ41_9PROT|nr:hypothetical protein [Inquilinus ginsengisoli]MDR6293883.1 hypothetical protein [Inquilinus ginsengisoli]